jgi:hypothetical protein
MKRRIVGFRKMFTRFKYNIWAKKCKLIQKFLRGQKKSFTKNNHMIQYKFRLFFGKRFTFFKKGSCFFLKALKIYKC